MHTVATNPFNHLLFAARKKKNKQQKGTTAADPKLQKDTQPNERHAMYLGRGLEREGVGDEFTPMELKGVAPEVTELTEEEKKTREEDKEYRAREREALDRISAEKRAEQQEAARTAYEAKFKTIRRNVDELQKEVDAFLAKIKTPGLMAFFEDIDKQAPIRNGKKQYAKVKADIPFSAIQDMMELHVSGPQSGQMAILEQLKQKIRNELDVLRAEPLASTSAYKTEADQVITKALDLARSLKTQSTVPVQQILLNSNIILPSGKKYPFALCMIFIHDPKFIEEQAPEDQQKLIALKELVAEHTL